MASGGYPGKYEKRQGDNRHRRSRETADVKVFHAGTKQGADGKVVTAGGRVLGVTALGATRSRQAKERAYEAVGRIHFEGMHFRRDIADKAIRHSQT